MFGKNVVGIDSFRTHSSQQSKQANIMRIHVILLTMVALASFTSKVDADELELIQRQWDKAREIAVGTERDRYQAQLENLIKIVPISTPDELVKLVRLSAERGDSKIEFDEVLRRRLLIEAVNTKRGELIFAVLTRCPPADMHYTRVERFIVEANGVEALDVLFNAADMAEDPWVAKRLFEFIRRAFPGLAAQPDVDSSNLTRECRRWIAARSGRLRLAEQYGVMNSVTQGMRPLSSELEKCILLTEKSDNP